jgi:hypothetical protein
MLRRPFSPREKAAFYCLPAPARAFTMDSKIILPSVLPRSLLARPIRMRHHPQNISPFVQNSRDVLQRAVRILAVVPERDAILRVEHSQRFRIRIVVTVAVPDGDVQDLSLPASGS